MEEREVGAAPEKEAPPPVKKLEMKVEKGDLVPVNSTELNGLLANIAAGGGFPARFENLAQRVAVYNLAHSLMGRRWQLIINNIANIKGQLSIFGEAPGALAEQTKEVAEKRMYLIDKDYIEISVKNKNLNALIFAGVCAIQRKGRVLKEYYYTVEQATIAGQIPPMKRNKTTRTKELNEDSPWHKHFPVMMMRKAMNIAIKFEFADAVIGVPIAEYDFDEAPDLTDMREVGNDSVAPATSEDLSNSIQDLP